MTFDEYPLHDSIRGWFGRALYFEMQKNEDIILLTGDLGYGLLDRVKEDFPKRFVNCGAAECCMVGAAVGLALSGKIPICYSITSFLLYRPFEWLRNYVDHENIPVLLIGSGLGRDYAHDGITHFSHDAEAVLNLFENIEQHYPTEKEQVPAILQDMIERKQPAFMGLRR